MHTIAIVNQKGGCGKTTTAINLAGVFASRGHRTLLVDMDPQSHCAAGLAIPENRIDLHIGDAMVAGADSPVDPARLLWRVSRNLDLAPSTLRLAAIEAPRGELAGKPDAERRLAQALSRFDSQYDICLIDCSPAIGLLAFNALVAAKEILIPVETGFFSLQGATKQVQTIKAIGKRLGVAPVHRILATMHEPGSMLSKDLLEELKRRFGAKLIPVFIRFDQSLRESASFGQPVIEYAPESTGARDYIELAEWLVTNALGRGQVEPRVSDEPAPSPVVDEPPVAPPVVIPAGGRAADMVQRTKRLQSRAPDAAELVNNEAAQSPGDSIIEVKAADVLRGLDAAPTMPMHIGERSESLPSLSPLPTPPPPRDIRGAAPAGRQPLADRPALPVPHPLASTRAGEPETHWPVARFGPQVMRTGVLFRTPASIGRSVAVAGDFNQWMPERTPLRLNEATGALEAIASIPPGSTSQYRLVIDGNWIADPYNPCLVPNPFGGTNSVVSVPMPTPEIVVSAAWSSAGARAGAGERGNLA